MRRLSEEIAQFFQSQSFVIVSTIDGNGNPHNSCNGIVKIDRSGLVYLLDLYREKTYENLMRNPRISVTAVDEHRFKGFCLKGKARIIAGEKIKSDIIKAWEDRLTSRITRRLIKNIQGEKGHSRHPEILMPRPEYLIIMQVKEVVDLTPHHIR